ncbi:hypothetical protein [Streptomyces sp. NPDC048825]|uniref:hypothetical protein n=1 Tax=Streptomyces sp. NPDC048825 TaxID=3365592 RepID=UPI0037118B90
MLQIAVLTGAVSISCVMVVSELLLLAGVLTPGRVLIILALVTTGAALAPAGRSAHCTRTENR